MNFNYIFHLVHSSLKKEGDCMTKINSILKILINNLEEGNVTVKKIL